MICDFRLKVFHTVAIQGSFTAAAKKLGITQPAVSNHISELENNIGDILFFRSRKETVLTPKGRILFDYAEKILNLYRCAGHELMPVKQIERRRIIITAVPDAARFILRPLVDNYTRIYPDTDITVLERSQEEAAESMKDSSVDLAVTDTPIEGSDNIVFATITIGGASVPMATYYVNRSADNPNTDTINEFLLCCRTFK